METRRAFYLETKTCVVCGKEFKAARSTAKYCPGGVCRQKAKRDRDVLATRTRTVINLLWEIEHTQEDRSFKTTQLSQIKMALDRAIEANSKGKLNP
jgi:hypothetical protein